MSAERLDYLRGELRAERISYGELCELQDLAATGQIDPGDTELLEAAGVPELSASGMVVEFLLAHEHGSWSTEAWAVDPAPDTRLTEAGDDEGTILRWAREHLQNRAEYRRIVCWGIMGVYTDGSYEGRVKHV